MNKPIVNPFIALAIGAVSVSTSAIFVKLATAPAPVTAAYRLFFTVLLMLPVILFKYRKELKLINRRDWIFTSIAGMFLALHFILWFESLEYTSVASSVVLVTLQPLFAFAGTYFFFKEKLTAGAALSVILALSGSFMISWGDFRISGAALFGDILALLGAAAVTGYFLSGQSVRKRLSLMTYTFVVYSISTGFLFTYSLMLGHSLQAYPKNDWLMFLLLAIFPTLLGHTLFNWALKWLSTSVISMSILFEPIGASILAYYILGETVSMTQVTGGFLILFGIFLFLFFHKRAERIHRTKALKGFNRRADV
ncbi:DMT family transporter [Bacillus marinisedimentorum]|uniref:DMT family transporter n=1 Tax=Bacillus marinisedimentorum TaxID=1821260 RepID=UPI000871CBF4|nr:DMT family transporter [Bacillus marinisedimentorum]